MISNLQSIGIDRPIPGLTGITYNRCTTLADVLAAIVAQAGSGADVHTVSGVYDPATETIVLTLSNGATVTIPASLLLPVVADGDTIQGNGTAGNKLVGYKVAYDATTGALTITPPNGTPVTVPAQTATEEKAADPHNLLGLGAGATVTTQQMLDYLAAHLRDCCPSKTLEIPTTAFADPANPTQAEADAWINAQGALGPGTQIVYNRPSNPAADIEDPDYAWVVNEIGDATNIESPALRGVATAAGSKATVAGDALNIPNPAPVAQIGRTSKIGLTASYSGAASSGTQQGNGLTYLWTVAARSGTTGTGTPATPAAATTTVTFSAPGQYDVTLTVTDANGATATEMQTITVSRVLEVGSPTESNNDYLATVTAALAWKNANDATNTYQIIVRSTVVEPASILNADRAHIYYEAGASSSFAGNGYSWTAVPVDARLMADRSSTAQAAVVAAGTALNLDNFDATNLLIEQIGLLSTGGRALQSNNMSNLTLRDVGTRATGSDSYTHAHTGGENVTIINCHSTGTGISYGLIAAQGRANTMRLIDSYGDVSSAPATFAFAALYVPGSIWVGTTQTILVMQNTLINNGAGNNGSGVPRSVVINGGSVTAVVTGAQFIDNTLIQNVAGNPVMRTQSADASRNVMRMVGNQLIGGVAFSNCASVAVTTTNSNDIL
jgi:PKD repeat protein